MSEVTAYNPPQNLQSVYDPGRITAMSQEEFDPQSEALEAPEIFEDDDTEEINETEGGLDSA